MRAVRLRGLTTAPGGTARPCPPLSPARESFRPYLSIFLAFLVIANLFVPAWGQLRLSDRPVEEELDLVPEKPAEEAPAEPAETFHFDQSEWNKAREQIEQGREPGEEEKPAEEVAVSTAPATTGDEGPLGIAVDLPYESGLSISGRKLIAIKLKETRRKSAKRAKELGVDQKTREFEMRQELQVRIKGKVGRKITVNVDFDDTKEDKRDISVVYQGDPEEIVQEAAFGDIVLSLPATEFVSYNKQLFGIRTKLKYKQAQLMAIGSRTKGVTETKRFSGNTQFERKEVSDTAYIRRRYYQLAFDPSHLPLVVGSEQIWLDNRSATDNNINTSTMTVEDFAVNSSSFTGTFDRLKPGEDYTVDYARGIITFRTTLAANAVVVADYIPAIGGRLSGLGTPGRLKILKSDNDLPIADAANELGYRRELKTFYSIGRNKIIRDNGRGNFILRTIDVNRNDTDFPLTSGATLRYPNNIEVDFEAGTFNIAIPQQLADTTLYDPTPTHKFTFLLEYRYRLKTYLVKPNIVLGSERVQIDGKLLTRDLDYFIDYDSGFLTFFNEDQISDTTQIEVTYEFAPFGGQLGQTLVGARTEFSIVPDRFFVGSTILYTFAPRPTILPDVRSTPASLMVLEADTRVDNVKIPFTPLTVSMAGEVAQSREDPNLFGAAVVDSMEGIKQEEQALMDVDFWQYASNPAAAGHITRPSALGLADEDIRHPSPQTTEGETLRVLNLTYQLATRPGFVAEREQVSIIQPLSRTGRDFSKKQFMEVWIQGSGDRGEGVDLVLDIGEFNEDADSDGIRDTEDTNSDGTLNTGEDIGWDYNGPEGPVKIGSENGRIDTEDLDADGVRDTAEITPRIAPLFRLSDVPGNSEIKVVKPGEGEGPERPGDLEFTGWRYFQIPLNIGSSEEPQFQNIKQVRLTLTGLNTPPSDPALNPPLPLVRLGKISFVGNRWEKAATVAGSSMTITAVNNIDNPDYVTLLGNSAYDDLYEDTSNRIREQALSLKFTLPAGSTASTRVTFPSPRDFSKHKALRYFVQSPSQKPVGERLFVQLGSETDYFEYSIPINGAFSGAWILEVVNLVDLNDDGLPDLIQPLNPNAVTQIVGSPSLTNVGQIKYGVSNPTTGAIESELWINEVHLSGARLKVGNARRYSSDFAWTGWGTFGGKFREVDRNFQTLTSQITNQDSIERSGYLNFNRLAIMPMSFSGSKAETITPAALRTGEAGLVSLLQEGRVEKTQGSAKGELILPYMPRIGYGYDKAIDRSTLLERVDDRDTYTGNLSYSFPWRPDLIPGRFFTLQPLPDSISVRYQRINYFLSFFPEKKFREVSVSTATPLQRQTAVFANVRTYEYTDDWSGRTNFVPWPGLTIAPSFQRARTREQRRFSEQDLQIAPEFRAASDYDKRLTQSVGLSASWRILRWLEPRLNYSLAGTETNVLPTVSSPTAFNQKSLDRTGDGEGTWTFTVRELFPNFRPTQSLSFNNSFRIQDGDTFENVRQGFNEWQKIQLIDVHQIRVQISTPVVVGSDTIRPGQLVRHGNRPMFGLLRPLPVTNLGMGARQKQVTVRNSLRSSSNWTPLDWLPFNRPLQPLKTFTLTATITNTDEHTETTETIRDSVTRIWPDTILSIRDTEKFFFLQRWMGNSQANYRFNRKKTETFHVQFVNENTVGTDYRFTLFRRYDFFGSYGRNYFFDRDLRTNLINKEGKGYNTSGQVGMKFGSWRFTPASSFRTDLARDGTGKTVTDLTSHNHSLKARFDKAYPDGFRFPFSRKVLTKVNRLIVDSSINYEHKKSSLNVERDNTDIYTANMTGEWEIAQNFRLSFGGATSLVNNRAKKDENLMTFEINSTLVIQF